VEKSQKKGELGNFFTNKIIILYRLIKVLKKNISILNNAHKGLENAIKENNDCR
jgi:hypothetical protein